MHPCRTAPHEPRNAHALHGPHLCILIYSYAPAWPPCAGWPCSGPVWLQASAHGQPQGAGPTQGLLVWGHARPREARPGSVRAATCCRCMAPRGAVVQQEREVRWRRAWHAAPPALHSTHCAALPGWRRHRHAMPRCMPPWMRLQGWRERCERKRALVRSWHALAPTRACACMVRRWAAQLACWGTPPLLAAAQLSRLRP